MERSLYKTLKKWQENPSRLPILLRGARQVGKTHLIRTLGKTAFSHFVEINFEESPEYIASFETLKPDIILEQITLQSNQSILPGETLLFLDEIQECPNAIKALRYFKEQMPKLHVIAAGSLLEFILNQDDFRMPVGRIQSLYLYPFSFQEFLQASGETQLHECLKKISLDKPLNQAIHEKYVALMKRYCILGGMPAVIAEYLRHQQLNECIQLQQSLIDAYRQDFGHYTRKVDVRLLQELFLKAPALISQQFKYSKINPDVRSRDMKMALQALIDAGLLRRVAYHNAAGVPLVASTNTKSFKTLLLDIGLVRTALRIPPAELLQSSAPLINQGALSEQLVGQELIAYESPFLHPQLYFWKRDKVGSQAEIDYLFQYQHELIPVEVKAGKTGRLKSLQWFMQEKQSRFGVKVSDQPLNLDRNVLEIPFYLVGELDRLISQLA